MKKEFNSYQDWLHNAENLGWIHIHDNFIVLDDSESGENIGEFDSVNQKGWIYKEFCEIEGI